MDSEQAQAERQRRQLRADQAGFGGGEQAMVDDDEKGGGGTQRLKR